jgi:Protein of unknown function (DUF1236)
MRAIKLITVSTVAVLMGSASLAIGQEGAGSLQGGSVLEETPLSQGSARGSETGGPNPRAAENAMRRSEASGERSSNIKRSHGLQRSQAMTAERGRTIAGARGVATTAERGRAIGSEHGLAITAEHRRPATDQGMKAAQIKSQSGSQSRQSFGQAQTGLAYGRADSDRNAGAGLNAEQRARLREILSARRDIPRMSNLADVRVNAVIPRSVRLAAIPDEVVRIYPRFRRHQAFIYRNQMVVVDPLTSRIVAMLPA